MTVMLCIGGKADGQWRDVDLEWRRVGDRWSVRIEKPLSVLDFDARAPQPPEIINVSEVYRIECLHISDPKGGAAQKLHFLVQEKIHLLDAMVTLFQHYAPPKPEDENRARRKPD